MRIMISQPGVFGNRGFGVSWLPPEVAAWLGTATEPFLPPLLALGLVTRFAALSHLSPIGTLDLE